MLGADYYQTETEIASLLAEGKVPIGVGRNTKIKYVTHYFKVTKIQHINASIFGFLFLFQLLCMANIRQNIIGMVSSDYDFSL